MTQFTYQSLILVLPSPKLRDTESIEMRTQIDRSLDGTIWTYKDLAAKSQFHLDFEHVNRPKIIEVINFLRSTAGKSIQYTDYNNQIFNVVVLGDPFESTHVEPRNNTFHLDLEVLP